MFCCFPPSRRSHIESRSDEKRPLLKGVTTTTINYQTIFAIPYAHVIRDDKIQIESCSDVQTNTADAYLLFNGTIANPAYETACFSFDDTDVSTPVMFATTTTDPRFLFERLFAIEHVSAINPSRAIHMQSINQTKPTTSSNALVATARPFDEYLLDPTTPLDVQGNSNVPKPDKN